MCVRRYQTSSMNRRWHGMGHSCTSSCAAALCACCSHFAPFGPVHSAELIFLGLRHAQNPRPGAWAAGHGTCKETLLNYEVLPKCPTSSLPDSDSILGKTANALVAQLPTLCDQKCIEDGQRRTLHVGSRAPHNSVRP